MTNPDERCRHEGRRGAFTVMFLSFVRQAHETGIVERGESSDTRPRPEVGVLFRNSRHLIVQVLSLALLIAQLGMQAHAYSHLKSDADSLPGQPTQLCGQCASSAPLLSMASSSSCIRIPYAPHSAGIAPQSIGTDVLPLPHPLFRSRAPPRFF
ncbi:MAG TPA: hypothetical protein VJS12_01580 [Steroidobacteraceae bacterium]|nr:hypothetical protein [Steroidobacteraceae bacterium]